MSDIEKIKETIRDLLNLARNDAAAEGEIRNAMAFANKLMGQHNLSEEDLPKIDEKLLDLETAELGKASSSSQGARRSLWEAQMARFVCDFVGGVKFWIRKHVPRKTPRGTTILTAVGNQAYGVEYTYYGLHEDALLAKGIHDEMAITIASMARLKFGGVFRGRGRSYCEGFVAGLAERLRDERSSVEQIAQSQNRMGIDSTALALIDNQALVVQRKSTLPAKYLKQNEMQLGKSKPFGRSYHDDGAHAEGVRDGRRAKVGGSQPQRLEGANG